MHLTRFDFGVIGEASANGQTANGEQRGQDLLAPLPTLTGQIKYRPISWLELRGRADYLDRDALSAALHEARAAAKIAGGAG